MGQPWSGSPDRRSARSDDGGQASVELALILPLVAGLLLAIMQAWVLARDQILVTHPAREAVRVAGLAPPPAPGRGAAGTRALRSTLSGGK